MTLSDAMAERNFSSSFPGWDPTPATGRVDDLLDSIRSRPFEIGENRIRLTCSIGVATFRPEMDSPSIREVLSRADTALYVAKNSGRNCASFEVAVTDQPQGARRDHPQLDRWQRKLNPHERTYRLPGFEGYPVFMSAVRQTTA